MRALQPRAAQRRGRVPRGAARRRRPASARWRGALRKRGFSGGAGRRRRGALEPRSHSAVPSRHHQDRPQPRDRRRGRLLQAGDVQEPGQPVPPDRRARGGGGDRDRGRGDGRARARGGPAAGLPPRPSPGGGVVRRRGLARASGRGRASSPATFKNHMVDEINERKLRHRRLSGILDPDPRRSRERGRSGSSTRSWPGSSARIPRSSAATCSTTRACR